MNDKPPESSRSTSALALERLLPPPARAAWERAFVTFACDELNGLYDRIVGALAAGEPVSPALKARALPLVQALSWDREVAARRTWEIARRAPDRPEDSFAPALILNVLLPDDAEAAAWVAARPPEVLAALAALVS
ncbi:MAG TPA: hypothetical protein VKZ18_23715 [Polyangia bacterium]|nr:hypothetical protein [Polyangia bacterium]